VQIHHLAMRTGDVARLERFYVAVLGLRVAKRDAARGSVWLEAGGAVVMLEPRREGEPEVATGSMELLAFAAGEGGSLEAWRERLAHAGVRVEESTAFTIYFRDPDGRRVAVSEYSFRC
jgi:catechol 2,3-dioxygenase-like lactoylglutathione lyase family enzyme